MMLRSLNVSVSTSKVCPVTLHKTRQICWSMWKLECLISNVKTIPMIMITTGVDDDPLSSENNSYYLCYTEVVRWQPPFTDLSNSLPVASHHSLVSHEFQQGAALTEFINCFLQVQESLPLLQSARQLATPGCYRYNNQQTNS